MKWRVFLSPVTASSEVVEAESAFTSQSGALIFNRVSPTPIDPDVKPTKRKPKAKTQLVRAFNTGSWNDVRLES